MLAPLFSRTASTRTRCGGLYGNSSPRLGSPVDHPRGRTPSARWLAPKRQDQRRARIRRPWPPAAFGASLVICQSAYRLPHTGTGTPKHRTPNTGDDTLQRQVLRIGTSALGVPDAHGCQDRLELSVEGPGQGDPLGWLVGHRSDAVVVIVVVEYRESGGFCCSCDHQIHRFRPAMLAGPG